MNLKNGGFLKIQAILFDCYGVLFNTPLIEFVRQNFRGDISPVLELMRRVHLGASTPFELYEAVGKVIGKDGTFVAAAVKQTTKINEPVVALARRWSANYRVGILSNAHADTLTELVKAHDLVLFEPVIASSTLRLAKPDSKIFLAALEMLFCRANEVVFIDDMQRNVDSALTVGMRAIRFICPEQLESDLAQLGVE